MHDQLCSVYFLIDISLAPTVPTAPELSCATSTSLKLSWTCSRKESVPISGFKIKINGHNKTSFSLADSKTEFIVLNDLEPKTMYFAQISAINLHGSSNYSTPSKDHCTLSGNLVKLPMY